MTNEERVDWLCRLRTDIDNGIIFTPWKDEFIEALNGVVEAQSCVDTEPQKIHEWEIHGKRAELWIVKGKLQIRALGTIHNVSLPLIQPCEDAVSREAMLDAFWKLSVELRPSAIDAILNMINSLPPVQPERKKGEWQAVDGAWACSECGCNNITDAAYCQWCGADMREGEQNG